MRLIQSTEPYVCAAGAPVREVMRRMNGTPELFQLVVAEDGRFLGTVTDGDFRRAILRGIELDSPVVECMNASPVVGHAGDEAGNMKRLQRAGGFVPFLPVVDDDGRLVHVLTVDRAAEDLGTALVMAGGFGRRLGEATRETPKPLLSVGGRPMIAHVLDRLEDAGFKRIVVSVHYLADKVERFIQARANRSDIVVMRESRPCGTAGAIAMLPSVPQGPFLVINADVMTEVDFVAMRTFHLRHGHDVTVAVAQHEVTIPFGVIRHNADGLMLSIEEKPKVRNSVAAGIYWLTQEISALIPSDRPVDMPEVLNSARETGFRVGLFPVHEYWRDIGRPADLAAADHDYTRTESIAAGGD